MNPALANLHRVEPSGMWPAGRTSAVPPRASYSCDASEAWATTSTCSRSRRCMSRQTPLSGWTGAERGREKVSADGHGTRHFRVSLVLTAKRTPLFKSTASVRIIWDNREYARSRSFTKTEYCNAVYDDCQFQNTYILGPTTCLRLGCAVVDPA
jgi:hypothetical protein